MMKKISVTLMVLFATGMQGMETNSLSITVGTTKINLTKGFIGDADNRVDMIVVGKKQQEKFTSSFFGSSGGVSCIGEISLRSSGTVHKNYSEKKQVTCSVVEITEPRMTEDYRNGLLYDAIRPGLGKSGTFSIYRGKENEAIREASKDVALCYNKALREGVQKLGDKQVKSIALSVFTAETAFPVKKAAKVIVRSIMDFIKNNPNAYAVVELIVNENEEFKLFKGHLEQ
jgi:hypothetical protein